MAYASLMSLCNQLPCCASRLWKRIVHQTGRAKSWPAERPSKSCCGSSTSPRVTHLLAAVTAALTREHMSATIDAAEQSSRSAPIAATQKRSVSVYHRDAAASRARQWFSTVFSGVTEQLGDLGHSLALGPLTPPRHCDCRDGCWQGWAGIVFQCDNRIRGKNSGYSGHVSLLLIYRLQLRVHCYTHTPTAPHLYRSVFL